MCALRNSERRGYARESERFRKRRLTLTGTWPGHAAPTLEEARTGNDEVLEVLPLRSDR